MTIQVTSLINEFITLTTVPDAPVVLSPFQTKRFDTSTITSELSDLDTLRRIQVDVVTDEATLSAEELASIKAILPKLAGMAAGNTLQQVFAQPDATGTWTGRPNALSVAIPSWANFLTFTLGASGGSGGSGRRNASLTARAGGAGGQAGTVNRFYIPLRDSTGALLATSGVLTVAASPAGGAAVTIDNTDGNAGAPSQSTTFVFAGTSYVVSGGGSAASGGTNSGSTPGAIQTSMFVTSSPASSSISASIATAYPNGIVGPGVPGGSISAADALLTVGGSILTQGGGGNLSSTTPGADGVGYQRGSHMAAVGGCGGAASSTAAAGSGGNGIYGSGGGGGGASLNGFNSGAGGRGGAGWAIFQWSP